MEKTKLRYQELKARAKIIDRHISKKEKLIDSLREEKKLLKDTKSILLESVKIINHHFKQKIEDISTNIIRKIFRRDISLEVEYEVKSYGIETKINVYENGIKLDPKDDMGGSIIEVISLLIRIILREISNKQLRKTIILDEAFSWAGDLIVLIAQIIKELSEDIQFIIISHDDRLDDIADIIYKIERQSLYSNAIRIK